jgi:hypothetical protein
MKVGFLGIPSREEIKDFKDLKLRIFEETKPR